MSHTESQHHTLHHPSLISSTCTSSIDPGGPRARIADWIAPARKVHEDHQSATHTTAHDSAEESEEDVPPPPQSVRSGPEERRPGSTHRRISSATDDESTRELWLRMVELQQRYGCYKSARMQAAASTGEVTDFMPSRVCLDLLNDGLETADLPPEGWKILGRFAAGEPQEPRARQRRWKVWKNHHHS